MTTTNDSKELDPIQELGKPCVSFVSVPLFLFLWSFTHSFIHFISLITLGSMGQP